MKKTAWFAAFLLLPAIQAWSQEVHHQDGISYVSGGIGLDEREAMKANRHGYNLFLTFAEKSGAFVADVQVVVKALKGKKGFDTVSEGPFLYAALPPGKYRVSVEFEGMRQSRVVNLGKASEVFYLK